MLIGWLYFQIHHFMTCFLTDSDDSTHKNLVETSLCNTKAIWLVSFCGWYGHLILDQNQVNICLYTLCNVSCRTPDICAMQQDTSEDLEVVGTILLDVVGVKNFNLVSLARICQLYVGFGQIENCLWMHLLMINTFQRTFSKIWVKLGASCISHEKWLFFAIIM